MHMMSLMGKNSSQRTFFVVFSLFFSFYTQLTSSTAHHPTHSGHETRGILLKGELMDILNMQLEQNPEAVLRINLACKSIKEVNEKIHKDENTGALDSLVKQFNNISAPQDNKQDRTKEEKLFVQTQLKGILEPVKKFLDTILSYSKVVEPIINESLSHHPHIQQSFLLKLFKTNTDIQAFCEKEISTKTDLKNLCSELLSFFNDLNVSLSDKANQEYKKLIQKLNAKKKGS